MRSMAVQRSLVHVFFSASGNIRNTTFYKHTCEGEEEEESGSGYHLSVFFFFRPPVAMTRWITRFGMN